jgi:hypothetical protein
MVLTCLRARREARNLAMHLAWSVLQEDWRQSGNELTRGKFQIHIGCRDKDVTVTFNGAPMWIPCFAQCRLKKAVRLRLTKLAMVDLEK